MFYSANELAGLPGLPGNASASALPISVKGSKQHLGFITCGKRSYEAVGSLGCTVAARITSASTTSIALRNP